LGSVLRRYDDVIRTAKVIVNPEQSAAELKRLQFSMAGAKVIIQTYAIMFMNDHDANYTKLNELAAKWLEENK
jgi:hypothetical protein